MTREVVRLSVDKIEVTGKRRPLDRRKCRLIAESIRTIGLQNPITVRVLDGRITLVVGLHRLEAMKLIGENKIDCIVTSDSRLKRCLWQNAENLWRVGLTALERAEGLAKWTRDAKKLANGKDARKGGKQPGDKGVSKSARKLGLPRETIRRALKIDSISPEAKEAAKKRGLDRNQDALLKIAKEAPKAQVGKVRELTTKPAPKVLSKAERQQLRGLMRRFEKAKNLRREISNASPFVCRKFATEIVKLGRSSAPNKSQ